MAVQLPQEVLGTAVGVLVFSFVCLSASLLMIVLVWVQHERTSYVAALSFLTAVSTTASIVQQVHTIIDWRDITREKFDRILADPRNPELSISGASGGVDLVLFYIQYYTYNALAMMTLFWAVELAASVFKWEALKGKRQSLHAKLAALILPAVQTGLLQLRALQQIRALYYVIANGLMAVSLSIGGVLLLLILAKYIRMRVSFLSWHVDYGDLTTPSRSDPSHALRQAVTPRQSIHDSWLVVRFTIAFVALGLFQVLSAHFESTAAEANAKIASGSPDFSIDSAREVFLLFMPGVSASLLVFIVFGTTKTLREHMWARLVPRRIRQRREAALANRLPSVVYPRGAGPDHQLALLQSRRRSNSSDRDDDEYGVGGVYPRLPPIASGDMGALSSDLDRIISKGGRDVARPALVVMVPGGRTRGSQGNGV